MPTLPASLSDRLRAGTLSPVVMAPVIGIAIFTVITAIGAAQLPGGYRGEGGLNALFGLCATVWLLGAATRAAQPGSKLAAAVQGFSAMLALSFIAGIATAVLATWSGPWVDAELAYADRLLFPFFDHHAMYVFFDAHPDWYNALARVYVTLNWQPAAFIALAFLFADARTIDRFVAAFAIGLTVSILPFPWLPGKSAFVHFGAAADGLADKLALYPAGNFLHHLENFRAGQIEALSAETIVGLVSIPSFHACAAVILACSFWHLRWLRWPFVALNTVMGLAAIPVGAHYLVDIWVGVLVGFGAVAGARRLDQAHWPRRAARATKAPLKPLEA